MANSYTGKHNDTGLPSVVMQRDTHARQAITNQIIHACQNLGSSARGRRKLARITHAIKLRRRREKALHKKKMDLTIEARYNYQLGLTDQLVTFEDIDL